MSEDYLVARIGGERFAIPATRVQSVIELSEIVPAPRAPAFIAGLATLRSRSLTVIDTARSLELAQDRAPLKFALVTELEGCGYALAVEAVENVVTSGGAVEPLQVKLADGWMRVARGVIDTPIGVILLIDLERLISGPSQLKAA